MPPVDITSVDMSAEQMAMGMGGGVLVIQIAFYILYAYSLFTLAKKLGEQYTWMAWVPILNVVLMIRMAKMSLWWILGLIVPFLNIYVMVKMFHNGISKRTGHGGWWTAGLVLLGFIFLPITAFTYNSTETVEAPTTPAV